MDDEKPLPGPKLVNLPQKDSALAATEAIRRDLPAIAEYIKIVAHIRWLTYCALVKEGFTKAEALALCESTNPLE